MGVETAERRVKVFRCRNRRPWSHVSHPLWCFQKRRDPEGYTSSSRELPDEPFMHSVVISGHRPPNLLLNVLAQGVEPRYSGSKPDVLPLDEAKLEMVGVG